MARSNQGALGLILRFRAGVDTTIGESDKEQSSTAGVANRPW